MQSTTPAARRAGAAAIAVASTLITLYAIELFLTLGNPRWIDQLGTTLRKGPSVIAETSRMRARGIAAYPFLQSDTFADSTGKSTLTIAGDTAISPLAGLAADLTILCNESGTTIGYRSDSLGFRNPADAWGRVHPAAALVGDSFAHGFCRPERETIAGMLRADGVVLVNAGVTGAGPLAELGILREYMSRVQPRVVYWLFYEGNDLIDLTSERKTSLNRYLQSDYSQHLVERKQTVDEAMRRFADSVIAAYRPPGMLRRVEAFLLLRQLRTATGLYRGVKLPKARDESGELSLLRGVLERADADVKAWGGRLRIVYLPERRRFNRRTAAVVGENHDPYKVQREVTRISADLGIPVLDAAAAFAAEEHPEQLWNARRYHYNAKGYAIVAKMIIADLH